MKRDLDLIRHILLTVESSSEIPVPIDKIATSKYTIEEIAYNIVLLNDAGYVVLKNNPALSNPFEKFYIERMTMSGCDYLDNVRDPEIWAKTKQTISGVVKSAGLDLVKRIAAGLIRSAFCAAGVTID
jgi:hypothetical protein